MATPWRCAALLLAVCVWCPPAHGYEPKGFIRVCRGRFADSAGRQWSFAGWNGFTALLNGAFDHLYNGKPDLVDQRMRTAKAAGLTAVRIWGHGDGTTTTLQTGPGGYDERVFRSLDYVVFKARQYNVRLLVSFSTYWQDGDGIIAFARWAGLTYPKTSNTPYFTEQWAAKDAFWNSGMARRLYRNHMNKLFNRKNTFNGIQYKNDWAIFGWNLFNEPRCPASQLTAPCTQRITNWGNAMYAFGKAKNKKQLFTFGEEGFFARNGYLGRQPNGAKWYTGCNPYGVPGNVQAGWASRVGQDFAAQHAKADFLAFHLWPLNWQTFSPSFATKWIQCHVNVCNSVGKPCVLEEFGRALGSNEGRSGAIAGIRNPYYSAVYKTVEGKVRNYNNMGGDMFWQWLDGSNTGQQNGVVTSDSTFRNLIRPHAKFMKSRSGAKLC